MSAPVAARGEQIASLDGIRAIAVMMVMAAHAGLEHLVPGGLGVTIFFVLSGYLITTLMRLEQRRTGTLDFRAFYLRRVLRLGPPLLIVVGLAGLAAAFGLIAGGFSRDGLLAVLFYYGNYHMIATDFDGVPAGIGVVWSLAVEEHYYLLYPPLALLLMRRRSPRSAGLLLLSACVLVLAWRLLLAQAGVSEAHLTMATDTRIDAILGGCALAFLNNPYLDPPPLRRGRDLALALACIALLVASLLWRDPLFRVTLRYSVQSLAVAGLLWLAVAYGRRLRWLNAALPVYLGTVSYTIYLSHQVIDLALLKYWPALPWYGVLPLTLLLSLAVAEAMRRWVERPCARLRRQLERRAPARAARVPAFLESGK